MINENVFLTGSPEFCLELLTLVLLVQFHNLVGCAERELRVGCRQELLKCVLRPSGAVVLKLCGARQNRQLIYLQLARPKARSNYWRWFDCLSLFLGRPQAIKMLLELQFL